MDDTAVEAIGDGVLIEGAELNPEDANQNELSLARIEL